MLAFDYSKLRGRIIEKYGTLASFSTCFGTSVNTLSLKMNNKVRFTSDDVVKIVGLLDIAESEVGLYFFTPKV